MSTAKGSSKCDVGITATTLYIRPLVGELTHDEILSHFAAFGAVNSVRLRNKPKYSYGFVAFALAESAAKALRIDFHEIAGRRVKVSEVAVDKYKNLTTLLDLNDDCILEILSMKCLIVRDLCAVAETCCRLKEIAGRREHKSCDLNSLSKANTSTDWEWYAPHPVINRSDKTAQRILTNFGSEISALRIGCGTNEEGDWTRKVLNSLTDHCSNNTLRSLELWGFDITENFTVKLRPLFKNLHSLTLNGCTFGGASKELFADCACTKKLLFHHLCSKTHSRN